MKFINNLRFGLKVRISLYERIAAFLDAGINLNDALKKIHERYKKSKDFRAVILGEWLSELNKGKDFSIAIKPWIPPSEFMLIDAGNNIGKLSEGLKKTVVLAKSSAENKATIIGGLIMPVFLFLMLFAMIIGFRVQMVPVFETILPLDEWPDMAKSLYDISSGLYDNFTLISSIMIILTVVIIGTLNRWNGKIRTVFDNLPPWSLYRDYQGSSFLISLASLMGSGVPGFNAIEKMNQNASPWMQYHLKQMMMKMRSGLGNPGKTMNTGMIDKETAGNIEDFSELGSFESAIEQIGTKALTDSVLKTKARMKGISTMLLFVVAGSVVTIYYSIFDLQQVVADKSNQQQLGS